MPAEIVIPAPPTGTQNCIISFIDAVQSLFCAISGGSYLQIAVSKKSMIGGAKSENHTPFDAFTSH